MKHISIDIETLGTSADAMVLQIGACEFDPATHQIGAKMKLNLYADEQKDRKIDFDTVRWWMEQDPVIAHEVFNKPDTTLDVAKDMLKDFTGSADCIWANPPQFDLVILQSLFGESPWSYRKERCFRTVRNLHDPNGKMKPPVNLAKHDALADAVWQASYLINIFYEYNL